MAVAQPAGGLGPVWVGQTPHNAQEYAETARNSPVYSGQSGKIETADKTLQMERMLATKDHKSVTRRPLCAAQTALLHICQVRLRSGRHLNWDTECDTRDELPGRNTETDQERHPENHKLNTGRHQPSEVHHWDAIIVETLVLGWISLSLALRCGRDIVAVSHVPRKLPHNGEKKQNFT